MSINESRETLVNGIRALAERSDKFVRLEQSGVFSDLIDEYESTPAMQAYLYDLALGVGDLHAAIKRDWHPRFQRGLELIRETKSQTRVLCAFGMVIDRIYRLEQSQLNSLESWAIEHPLNGKLLTSTGSNDKIRTPNDIVNTLNVAFSDKGQKPTVDSPELRTHLCSNEFPIRFSRTVLGGAAGIIAEALAQMGVDTRVYSMYHPKEQAELFDERLSTKWLDLSSGSPSLVRAYENGRDTHPTRYTMVLTYTKGSHFRSHNIRAKQTDRSLLLLKFHFGKEQNATPLTFTIDGVDWRPSTPLGPLEWPSVIGFVSWKVQTEANNCLAINFVGDDVLEDLAHNHHYIALSAPNIGHLQHPNDPPVAALLRQLRTLKRANATIHLEISGGAEVDKDKFTPFAAALNDTVRSLGINDTELRQFACLSDFWPGIDDIQQFQGKDIYHRYRAGLRLAESLHLDRLYIHGNDVDIVLRKGASEAALQQEVHATLLTKGAVVVSILLRNDRELSEIEQLPLTLHHKGFFGLIDFSWQFSSEHFQEKEQRKRIFKHMVHNGYYLADTLDEYSIVVVPVMWPDIMNTDLNTTGAGDICSGISLLYSGWR